MPNRFRILAIELDAVLGVWSDEFDVQHPQVRRLERGAAPSRESRTRGSGKATARFTWSVQRARDDELHLLDADRMWIQRLTIPSGSALIDADRNWGRLLRQRRELDVQTLAVSELMEGGTS